MAIVDMYVPLNMLEDVFFGLRYYSIYNGGTAKSFTVDYYDGTSHTFFGSGFLYWSYGTPFGPSPVTDYETTDSSGNLLVGVYEINVRVGDIVGASTTSSTADDLNIVRTVLAGADTVYGSDYADVLDGFKGNDTIYGYDGNDTIYGEVGNDYLNGMSGADNMRGGAGNDVYVVDNAGDIVNESLAGSTGTDRVQSSISFSLANTTRVLGSVEYLTLLGTGNINGMGNALSNVLTGNAGSNVLNGGGGADTMNGGAGNDTYYVDNTGDVIVEASTAGRSDWIGTSVSYALSSSAYVEKLSTTSSAGTTAINLTGNGIAQVITGNAGSNVLNGGGGADTMNGGAGNDLIYGGAGNDRLAGAAGYDSFVFNIAISAATNVDTILDFNVVQDTIRLDNAVMPGLGSHLGTLSSAAFWKGTTGLAHDANDHIIYETDSGWLNYDSNGNAAGGSVHIATLAPSLALSYADFIVI